MQVHVEKGEAPVYFMDKTSKVAYHRLNASKAEMQEKLIQYRLSQTVERPRDR